MTCRRIVYALLVISLPLRAQSPQVLNGVVTAGVVDSLASPTLGEYRRFFVSTPPSYRDTTFLPRRYPVLYLLDGDAYFSAVSGMVHLLSSGIPGASALPEMIVVGVANTNRTRDLTPTQAAHDQRDRPQPGFANSGGNPKFLNFVTSELIPRIESSYRTEPYRILFGHSFGGITAINALYTLPTTFNAYIASDPALWWDKRSLLRQAPERFSKPGLAGRTLFVAQANTIEAADTIDIPYNSILRFNGILQQRNASGLRYGYKHYPDDNHSTVPLIAAYDGLRFIFGSYKVSIVEAAEHPDYIPEHFARISATLGYRVDPPEKLVDGVANLAYAFGYRDGSLRLFELNARLYPTSAYAQLELGEFWLERNDRAKALGYYEKALAMRPGFARAKAMVDSLRSAPR